jgi:CxxC-x17-CxxC domain-containing protein
VNHLLCFRAKRKIKEEELLLMMSYEGYQDRILTCRDCGQEFTFTAGEQEFFASKGLTNAPSRCPECRKARRNGGSSQQRAPRGEREQFDAICASCGKATTVPFMPREDRPVYCSDCFQEQRASRPSRGGGYGDGGRGGYNDGGRGGRGGRDRGDRGSSYDRW